MSGFLGTRLGIFVKAMAETKPSALKKEAYNDSVLDQMTDLNVEYQLDELGVFADGTDVPDYSPFTVQMKRAEGKRFDHMNFDDTGETRKSITYTYNGKLSVNYTDRFGLVAKYGQVFGLTMESIDEIQPEIIENIQDAILNKL